MFKCSRHTSICCYWNTVLLNLHSLCISFQKFQHLIYSDPNISNHNIAQTGVLSSRRSRCPPRRSSRSRPSFRRSRRSSFRSFRRPSVRRSRSSPAVHLQSLQNPPVQVEDGEICKCSRFKVNLYDKEHKQKWNWNPFSFSTTPANLIDC